ncbi:DUF359 domain-containing protein [Candidatus Parvarchaeota archaeon]|nr:DUF359 domain-containing protein [Candidatus Parvarchaeota archaeon]
MDLKPGEAFLLPEHMRYKLKAPFGKVLSEQKAIGILEDSKPFLITVGDVVTKTVILAGLKPGLAVFDSKTRRSREKDDYLLDFYKSKEAVKNPPGHITYELWHKVGAALAQRTESHIFVDGEEDLAAIPCVLMGRTGDVLLYGVPDSGIGLVQINNVAKDIAYNLLRMMYVEDTNKSHQK